MEPPATPAKAVLWVSSSIQSIMPRRVNHRSKVEIYMMATSSTRGPRKDLTPKITKLATSTTGGNHKKEPLVIVAAPRIFGQPVGDISTRES